MRCITLVDSVQYDFDGNIFKSAIDVGDIDNDLLNELVVGNQNGDLAVFKGCHTSKPWKKASGLGMITAIAIGDVFNLKRNSLVVINGDGCIHIFDLNHRSCEGEVIEPVHSQRLPPNVKAVILDDVNDDGEVELVIVLTDRVVRSYKWVQNEFPHRKSVLPSYLSGKLMAFNKWEFANQIGNITRNMMADGTPTLLVSHPGGTYIRLKLGRGDGEMVPETSETLSNKSVAYHTLGLATMRNPNVATEILGFIKDNKDLTDKAALPFAVATLDGTLSLVKEDVSLWSLQVDHQLFSLHKLDVTGDGREEIVVCAWDGYTYIVNTEGRAVRFSFGQPVSSFCAGYYSVDGIQNSRVFVYTTFDGKIHVHYNVHVERMDIVTYTDFLSADVAEFLKVHIGKQEMVKEAVHFLLYGCRQINS